MRPAQSHKHKVIRLIFFSFFELHETITQITIHHEISTGINLQILYSTSHIFTLANIRGTSISLAF